MSLAVVPLECSGPMEGKLMMFGWAIYRSVVCGENIRLNRL